MNKYIIYITEYKTEDNYITGETENSTSTTYREKISAKNLESAITKAFKLIGPEEYVFDLSKAEHDANQNIIIFCLQTNKNDTIPTEKEIDYWKKDVINLYNSYFHIHVEEIVESDMYSVFEETYKIQYQFFDGYLKDDSKSYIKSFNVKKLDENKFKNLFEKICKDEKHSEFILMNKLKLKFIEKEISLKVNSKQLFISVTLNDELINHKKFQTINKL